MSRLPLVATVAVVGVVAAGGLMFLGNQNQSAALPSASTPAAATTAPTASAPAGEQIPAELRYRWIGDPRDIGRGMMSRTGLNLTKDSYYLSATQVSSDLNATLLGSLASITGPGELTVVTPTASDALCAEGATGIYRYELSPSATQLSVTKVSDPCAARAIAMPGDWYRVACKDTTDGCWGDLEAGTYPSQYLDPRLDPGEIWHVPFGAFGFTVPDGWANSSDWPSRFSLTPAADYALESPTGPPEGTWHGIFVYTQPAASGQNAACSNDERTDVARTPAGLVEWVSAHPGVDASAPVPVTIDGHQGLSIDVAVKAGYTASCPDADVPIAILLAEASKPDGWNWGLATGERQRLIFLDIGDGDVVLIGIDTTYTDRFDSLVAESMPIIESFTFK